MDSIYTRIKNVRTHFSLYQSSDRTLNDICSTFNISKNWLLYGKGEMKKETIQGTMEKLREEYNLDNFSFELVHEYLKLDIEKRDSVQKFFYRVFQNQQNNTSNLSEQVIEKELNSYRKELEAEKKGTISSASANISEKDA